jgi:SAM-dependent methyltransferase
MGLDHVRRTYEQLGREDPLWAVLSHRQFRGNRWDPDAFFRTGVEEVEAVLQYVAGLGLEHRRGRALDFGCGVGRLTQALAGHFDEVVGVDISETMVAAARRYDRHGQRVRYVTNTVPDLSILDDDSFDVVYSSITLQHIPPAAAERYVSEFIRVIRPGGIAVFQMRNGPRVRPGTLRSVLYTLNRIHVRRLLQRLRGRPPYEMHYVARSRVEEVVSGAGGQVVHVADMSLGRPGKSLRYCATK